MNVSDEPKRLTSRYGFWLWGLAALIVVIGVLMLKKTDDQATYQGPKEKVSIGISATSMLPSLIHVAAGKGYFLEEGIEAEIIGYPTGKDALNAVLNDEVNIGTVAGPPIVFNSFERNDFAIFATILDSAQHTKSLARKSKGINSPGDLVGKKVATTLGTSAHFYMYGFFLSHGIDADQIEVVNLKPKKLVNAIVDGQVDAIFGWEPNITKAKKILGDEAFTMHGSLGYAATFALTSKKHFIEGNPELIKKLIRALRKAEQSIKDNRDESISITASAINTDVKDVESLWDLYTFRLSLNQKLLLTLEDQARWFIETGLTDKKNIPNYMEYINLNGMQETYPQAVSIIR